MVLLTMTPAMVEALERLEDNNSVRTMIVTSNADEPALSQPAVGNPITHGQVINISARLETSGLPPSHLDTLLRGSRIYNPPPPPKAEPVSHTFPFPTPCATAHLAQC